MTKVTISRMSADALQDEGWTFRLIPDTSGCHIIIERYNRYIRASKRHRWESADRYDITANSGRTLNNPVGPPADVAREALEAFHKSASIAMDRLLLRCTASDPDGPPAQLLKHTSAA